MSQYPATPLPSFPYDLTVNWKTIVSSFDSGKEQRRQKQLYPKYDVSLTYALLTELEIATLWNFYQARKGSYEAFYFYTFEIGQWTGLFVGTGDGVSGTFDIPGKSTYSQTIYVNGVALEGAGYTITAGGGGESSDRIEFGTVPALNDIITCDFTGYMRVRCRFAEDKMTKSLFMNTLYKTGLQLKGLTAL